MARGFIQQVMVKIFYVAPISIIGKDKMEQYVENLDGEADTLKKEIE